MSARESKSNRRVDASKQDDASITHEKQTSDQALQTFAVDVSAGGSWQLDLSLASPSPVNEKPAERGTDSNQSSAKKIPYAIELPAQPPTIDAAQPSLVAPASKGKQKFPTWWLASLAVHVFLLLGLGFSTLVIIQQQEFELIASPVVYEAVEEFEDVAIDPSDELDPLDESLEEMLEPITLEEITDPLEALSPDPLAPQPTPGESASADGPPAEISNPLTEVGGGAPASERVDGEATASFFGTKVKARRILYMLDNSGGMLRDGKFEALVQELQTSISQLQPRQQFYVVFYSDTVYPLFYPHSVMEFVRPNKRIQRQLTAWLESVELCTGNAIDEALAAAEVIRPDAIFLLTDGDLFTTAKKRELLLNSAGRNYSLYTFGMGVSEGSKTGEKLRLVAETNGGTFQSIKISDEIRSQAQQRPRPYHKDGPGAVWGLKVR